MEELEKLLASKDIKEIARGLILAEQYEYDVEHSMYDFLFKKLYRYHTKMKKYEEVSDAEKIRSINVQERYNFSFSGRDIEIPVSSLKKFKNLTHTEITCDRFGKLHSQAVIAEVFKLRLLKYVRIKNYPLFYLNFESANLENLEELNLEHNQIEEISKEISSLSELKKLIILGNPISKDELKIRKLKEWIPNADIVI